MTEGAGRAAEAGGRARTTGQAAETARDTRHVRQVHQGQERQAGPRDAGGASLRHEDPPETPGGDSQ